MKKLIKLSALLIIFYMIISIFPSNSLAVEGSLTAEQRETVANFARAYVDTGNSMDLLVYSQANRKYGYDNILSSHSPADDVNASFTNKLAFDCSSFVSFVYNRTCGVEFCDSNWPWTTAIYNSKAKAENKIYKVGNYGDVNLQPGDMLWKDGHIAMYIGNNQVAEAGQPSTGLSINDVNYRGSNWSEVYRLCEPVSEVHGFEEFTWPDGNSYSYNGPNIERFQYEGLSNGSFGAQEFKFEWVVNSLADLADWYIGIITYITRAIILGYATIVESAIDVVMTISTGEAGSITIEKIVNNKVPFLDVNFFNFSVAGGHEIEADSILYVIRENVASWYYIIRTVSIIGLLITLLYIGVRMALESAGERKSKYKQLLVSWLVSFIIVFFIHYYMIIILNINTSLIDIVNTVLGGAEESLYDSIRSAAYAIQASIGWPALIIHLAQIYLLIRFLFMYLKRLLVVAILTFMAPIIGVTYSIDKIKDNKSQSLSNWLKEYTFNVLLQSVHALLYTLFVGLALNMLGDSILGAIIAILLVNFMLKAESIFKKIFGVKSGSIKDALKSSVAILAGASIAKNFVKVNVKSAGFVAKPVTMPAKIIASKTWNNIKGDRVEKIKGLIEEAQSTGQTSIKMGLNTFDISELMKEPNFNPEKVASKLAKKELAIGKKAIKGAKDITTEAAHSMIGMAETIAAVPLGVVNEEEGLAMFAQSRSHFNKGINGYNKDKKYYRGKGKTINNILTGGIYKTYSNLHGQHKDLKKSLKNEQYNTQHEIAMKKAQKQINKNIKLLIQNPDINQKELEKVIEDESRIISEDVIFNATYKLEATIDNQVSVTVAKNGTTSSKNKKDINGQIEKLAVVSKEIDELNEQIEELKAIKKNKTINVDSNQFKKNVRAELVNIISKQKNKRKIDVTKKEIEDQFRKLSDDQKKQMLKKSMFKATELTDKAIDNSEEVKDRKSNLRLDNVDDIINIMKESSKLPINTKQYKKNFKELIIADIAKKDGISPKQVNKDAIDSYISNLTNKELIRQIRIAGAEQGSLRSNKNANKKEYEQLIEDIRKAKYHSVRLKGKKDYE